MAAPRRKRPHELDQLGEMVAAGTADVHSHTYGLRRFLLVGEDGGEGDPLTGRLHAGGRVETEDEYRALADLVRAHMTIESNLVGDALAFAYPWGRYSDEVIALAVEAGHRLLFTTEDGVITVGSDPVRLPRKTFYPYLTPDQFRRFLEEPGESGGFYSGPDNRRKEHMVLNDLKPM